MANTTKTAAGSMTVETSASNLDLNITNEDEFNNLIAGYRKGFHKTAGGFKTELKSLGERKREALWRDLAAALSVIEIISQPAYAEWLDAALKETDVPVVEDDEKQNVYVMYLRLLMGYWPDKPKAWKVGDPEPAFTWSENVWLYASVLRGAVKRGIAGKDLYDQLVKDKGLNKCKEEDRTRLATDQEEKDKKERFKAVTADDQIKVRIAASGFGRTLANGDYVALYGRVSTDKQTIEVMGLFDDKTDAVASRIQKVANATAKDVMLAQKDAALESKDAENAGLRAEKEELQRRLDEAMKNGTATVHQSPSLTAKSAQEAA